MKIYITGISGAGKTSIARTLIARGVNAIDIDEISHWENKKTGEVTGWEPGNNDEWNDVHAWVCNLSKLKEIISKSENSVALGHASNQEDYISLFDEILVLKCKPETIISRIMSRTDNDFGKHPLDQARILEWHKGFDDWMISKGAKVLDGERPIEEIVGEVELHLSK